jgi:hypothetical protein
MGDNKIHRLYRGLLILVALFTTLYIANEGYDYYSLSVENRIEHHDHQMLKPSGNFGHGYGIIGSLMMLIGVSTYMIRKRVRKFSRIGLLKYWLEFHIFLCSLGPILVLFHTAFKFGGIVAISFWSMVAVVISGVIGRYIYLQIPRTLEGREMSLNEINGIKDAITVQLDQIYHLDENVRVKIMQAVKKRPDRSGNNMLKRSIAKFIFEINTIKEVKSILKQQNITGKSFNQVMGLIRNEINLSRKIDRLITMQNLFRYWHVAHLPFAFLMLIIFMVHVVIAVTFGYRWIF